MSTNHDDLARALAEALPGISVVKGRPDEEELAALVASLVSAQAARQATQDDGRETSIWGDPRRRWGVPTTPNRAAWRWSTHQAW